MLLINLRSSPYLKVTSLISCAFPLLFMALCMLIITQKTGKKPSSIWDRLVFSKIKEKLGGRVRCMVSGGSALSPEVMDFLRV